VVAARRECGGARRLRQLRGAGHGEARGATAATDANAARGQRGAGCQRGEGRWRSKERQRSDGRRHGEGRGRGEKEAARRERGGAGQLWWLCGASAAARDSCGGCATRARRREMAETAARRRMRRDADLGEMAGPCAATRRSDGTRQLDAACAAQSGLRGEARPTR
jgi:hypothetical protein